MYSYIHIIVYIVKMIYKMIFLINIFFLIEETYKENMLPTAHTRGKLVEGIRQRIASKSPPPQGECQGI